MGGRNVPGVPLQRLGIDSGVCAVGHPIVMTEQGYSLTTELIERSERRLRTLIQRAGR